MTPLQMLRHHVTGAIERGEKTAIVEQRGETLAGALTMKNELLAAVGAAGEAAGYWTVYTRKGFEEHTGRIDVRDAAGREFYLSAGGYSAPGKIVCDAVDPEDRMQGLSVRCEECRAGISNTKAPDVIAKDAFRRVVGNAAVVAGVDKARAELKAMQEQRAAFRAMVQGLRDDGWRVSQEREGEDFLPRGETWQVTLYKAGVPAIHLLRDGRWRFVHSQAFNIADLAAVLALLKD